MKYIHILEIVKSRVILIRNFFKYNLIPCL
jgi:hypothetical protein